MTSLVDYLDKIKHLIPPATELGIETIEGGYSNYAYLLSWSNQPQWVLRVPGLDAELFQMFRFAEKKVLEVAVAQLLSPPCIYFDADSGLMVSKYVPQHSFDWDVEHEDLNVIRLAKCLAKIHELPINDVEFRLDHIIPQYLASAAEHAAEDENLQQEVLWLSDIAKPFLAKIKPYQAVMCHNDLNPKNCLADELHFWVIDWEYAGEGDPLFDVALVFASHNFTEEQKALFFKYYSCDIPAEQLQPILDNYQILYKIREMAWMLLRFATATEEADKSLAGYYHFKDNYFVNHIPQEQ